MAAGHSIGTIFVELDLSPDRYLKGQQKLLKDAQTASTTLEQNFKNLGIKSAGTFDLMRSKTILSFEAIAKSSKATANDIIRAEEAKNAKLKALNDQQFGAHVSTIDKIKKNWIAASAAATAAIVAINRAIAYAEQGAKAMQVESSFKIMADSAGVNSERLIASMKEATKETIDDSDMMQKAVKLMTLGYNPEQIERFSKVVITASQIAGTTATEAYESLADAIANKMPKSLIKMGAATREQMKIVNKAIEAGADSAAIYELAMANLELKQKMLQGTQNEALVTMERLNARISETTEAIGKGLILAIDYAYRGFEYLSAGVLGLVSAYARYRQLVYEVMGDEKQASDNRFVADVAYEAREDLLKRASKGILDNAETEKRATKEEIDGARAKIDAQMAAMKDLADAAAGRKDMLSALKSEATSIYDQEIAAAEHAAKMKQDIGENELAVQKTLYSAKESSLTKWYNAEYEAITKWSKTTQSAQAAVQALNADYSKKWEDIENKKQEMVNAYAKKNIEAVAGLYKTINEYSTESVDAEINNLILRYMEVGRWTDKENLLYAALAEEKAKIEDRKTSKAIAGFEVINEYSDQSYAARKYQYERESKLIESATNGEVSASDYVAKKVQADREKMLSAAAAYYDAVRGYSGEWLILVTANLEAEREKVAQVTKDEALSYRWLADQKRKAQNAAAIKGDDFGKGFAAQMDEYVRTAATAGEQGANVAKAITSSMEDNMAKFFDSSSNKFLSFKELAISTLQDISNALIKELITKPLTASMASGGGGLLSGFLGMFGSMFGGGGSATGMGTNTTFSGGGDMGGYMAMVKHSGGLGNEPGPTARVPAWSVARAPSFHTGVGPDEVIAKIRKDEGVFTPGQMKAMGSRSLSINVPVSITGGSGYDERRLSARMRDEVEATAKRVIAEEMR